MAAVTALVGELKEALSIDHIAGILQDYREVQQRFIGGATKDFIKEVTDFTHEDGVIRFRFRWDDVRTWEEDEETREAKRTFRSRLAIRKAHDRVYVFVYAKGRDPAYAMARLSEALFRKMRQIRRVTPTPELFNFILDEELTSATSGGFRITRLPGTEAASVSGSFDPDSNPYWRRFIKDGVIRRLSYEHQGRRREYSISSAAIYSVEGTGVDEDELERYTLEVLVPNL